MSLQIGNANATSGMSRDIYNEIEQQLSEGMEPEDLENVRPSWKKLAFAVATGVINHIKANVEIAGIQTTGDVSTTVQGTVSGTNVSGTGAGTVNSMQSGPTTGHVS